jgi:hypothetical protein
MVKMKLDDALRDIKQNKGRVFRKLSQEEQIEVHLEYERRLENDSRNRRAAALIAVGIFGVAPTGVYLVAPHWLESLHWAHFVLHFAAVFVGFCFVYTKERHVARSRDELKESYVQLERLRNVREAERRTSLPRENGMRLVVDNTK